MADRLTLTHAEVLMEPDRRGLDVRLRATGSPALISALSQELAGLDRAAIVARLAKALGNSPYDQYGVAGHPHRGLDPLCHADVGGRDCRLPLEAHQGHRYEGDGDECGWTGDGGQMCYRTRREHPRA